jgi:NADH-quinone oxidoreductase subunit G
MTPLVRHDGELEASSWQTALNRAVEAIRKVESPEEVAILSSGRMTNEELWLTAKLASAIGTKLVEIVPRKGESDDILLSADRNPNTAGAALMGVTTKRPGYRLGKFNDGIRSGRIKLLLALGEDATEAGIATEDLGKIPTVIALNILPNETTRRASVVLPSAGFAEKRGSMINRNGRLQRLNSAIEPPGEARDDWEILRDLLQGVSGSNGFQMLEDVFREMAAETAPLNGLNLGKIGDLGLQLELTKQGA